MKRLTLSFDKKNKDDYPWILKHPKVKDNLARFKNRHDAIDWFLDLDYECYIWFQNNEGIFGGQLACIENEAGNKKEMIYIPKVTGFDGGEKYDEICSEFRIHPSLMTRYFYKKQIDENLKKIDFKLESDPKTYFPKDLEMTKKKTSTYFDLTSIRANLEAKIEELQKQKNIADETIDELKKNLKKEKTSFESLSQQIEDLKSGKKEEVKEEIKQEAEPKEEPIKQEEKMENNIDETQVYDPNQGTEAQPNDRYADPNAQYAQTQYADLGADQGYDDYNQQGYGEEDYSQGGSMVLAQQGVGYDANYAGQDMVLYDQNQYADYYTNPNTKKEKTKTIVAIVFLVILLVIEIILVAVAAKNLAIIY